MSVGGSGGYGNVHFKSALNRRPLEFTEGQRGEEKIVELELKTIADVGLVGNEKKKLVKLAETSLVKKIRAKFIPLSDLKCLVVLILNKKKMTSSPGWFPECWEVHVIKSDIKCQASCCGLPVHHSQSICWNG